MSAHFSFSNSLYDKCNLDKKNQESIEPFNWITDSVYENNSACFVKQSQFTHNQFKNIPSSVIDIESDLRNQNRVLSRCPETRYDPTKFLNCKDCKKCDQGLPCSCLHCQQTKQDSFIKECKDNSLVPEYTRINKSCNIFSGITINRFTPLFEDVQDLNKIQSNSYAGANTRLQIKDAYASAKKN